jgi:hypothetical protein
MGHESQNIDYAASYPLIVVGNKNFHRFLVICALNRVSPSDLNRLDNAAFLSDALAF